MPVTNRSRRVPRLLGRRGFTLVELLVVVVLLGLVGSALIRVLVRQQRFFRSASDLLDMRSQLRQASGAISADLRGVSAKAGDILAVTDSSIDFRQSFGSSVVCKINTTTEIVLPPTTLSSGAILTSWLTTPKGGSSDKVMVLDEAGTNAANDDIWQKDSIVTFTPGLNTCPTGAGNLTSAGDATSNSYVVDLATALPATVKVGAPVRFYHRAHYSLYQGSDASWYLGYCSPDCATSGIQPIAGPFLPYNTVGTGGLTFTYYDGTGAVTSTLASIARIRMVIRGQTRSQIQLSGIGSTTAMDSVVVSVALRNR